MGYSSAVRDLVNIGDGLFSKQKRMLPLWQDIAENFYPERADFITNRTVGADFAGHLMSSFPVLMRRELGNLFGSFLRPRSTPWGAMHASDAKRDKDNGARMWLEWASGVWWRATYDPAAQFVRATKEADHDFAAFGQAVLTVEPNKERSALLFRNWHLRDCAWSENYSGKVDTMYRKWKEQARSLVKMFPQTVDEKVRKMLKDEPHREIPCRHMCVPSEAYDLSKGRTALKFTSVYIDEEHETVLEETPMAWFMYVPPRWQTVSGSQYARSPATELTLPDARLHQAMWRVILEAGEKAVDPPLVGPEGILRSDANIFAGGLTTYDADYDEKTGEALRALMDTTRGVPIGMEMSDRVVAGIKEGFFLNKLVLPELKTGTTAYQVRKMLEDMVRQQAPIFEPIEEEYNAAICNTTFDVLRAMGAFGNPQDVPPALQGAEINFTFKSPLREIADEMKGQQLAEGIQIVGQAAAIDPAQVASMNLTPAVRDALRGIGWPAEWIADESAVPDKQAQIAQQQQNQLGMAGIAQGADAAHKFGQAANQINQAGLTQ